MAFRDYYAYLELRRDATPGEIKRAYRRLVRVYHPDATGSADAKERFHRIQEAYEVLSDAARRKQYDIEHRNLVAEDERIRAYQRQQAAAEAGRGRPPSMAESDLKKHSEAERRWKILQAYYQSRKTSGDNANTKARRTFGPKFIHALFHKLKRSLAGIPKKPFRSRVSNPLRRPTPYPVTISTLESLNETFREIVIQGSPPVKIRLKIPAGVENGDILRARALKTDTRPAQTIAVKVHLEPSDFIQRDEFDITLRIPITVLEAVSGAEIEVPTLEGRVRVRILTPWKPSDRIRLVGKGLRTASGSAGDLYIKTYIVLPEINTEPAKQAAQVIQELYTASVRRDFPRSLGKAGPDPRK